MALWQLAGARMAMDMACHAHSGWFYLAVIYSKTDKKPCPPLLHRECGWEGTTCQLDAQAHRGACEGWLVAKGRGGGARGWAKQSFLSKVGHLPKKADNRKLTKENAGAA